MKQQLARVLGKNVTSERHDFGCQALGCAVPLVTLGVLILLTQERAVLGWLVTVMGTGLAISAIGIFRGWKAAPKLAGGIVFAWFLFLATTGERDWPTRIVQLSLGVLFALGFYTYRPELGSHAATATLNLLRDKRAQPKGTNRWKTQIQ